MNNGSDVSPSLGHRRWNRAVEVQKVIEFRSATQDGQTSQRLWATGAKIPRTTLQHWLKKKKSLDADPELIAFFESPAGLAFLHRLVTALHVVMGLLGNCGIRLICRFLELTGLDVFVASSYHAQRQVAASIEEKAAVFGSEEGKRLGKDMHHTFITVTEDENFHDGICLVAIEPVSNFIILEKFSEHRDAKTWNEEMNNALADWSVTVVQATSDEAKGLRLHAKTGLSGAHHSPDLFHVQYEVVKGTSTPLAICTKKAEDAHSKAAQHTLDQEAAKDVYQNKNLCEQSPDFEHIIAQARNAEQSALEKVHAAQALQKGAKTAIQEISDAYHPFDLKTGQPRSPAQVGIELEKLFDILRSIAKEADLSESSLKRIEKARRQLDAMIATIAFFFCTLQAYIKSLELSPEQEQVFCDQLVPALYLLQVAAKAKTAEKKKTLLEAAESLLQLLRGPVSPFAGLDAAQLQHIEKTALDCANRFQRSSSCVEGRNGQLALRHHHLQKIRQGKLKALTTMHNFVATRADGTTAAERFFGNKPRDFFGWLLDRIDLPSRPAQKRAKMARKAILQVA